MRNLNAIEQRIWFHIIELALRNLPISDCSNNCMVHSLKLQEIFMTIKYCTFCFLRVCNNWPRTRKILSAHANSGLGLD